MIVDLVQFLALLFASYQRAPNRPLSCHYVPPAFLRQGGCAAIELALLRMCMSAVTLTFSPSAHHSLPQHHTDATFQHDDRQEPVCCYSRFSLIYESEGYFKPFARA